jgi:DNA-binding CsgD family transcriptional regulator
VLILLAILYALVFSLILLLSRRGDSRPDTRVLRLVFITTACFTPGIILNTLAGDGIITWPAVQSYLGIEVHSVYLAVTGVLLLVMARQVSAPAPAPGAGISERLMADLSEREREVIGHLLQGRANREIAEILYISESTVKKHINSAFRKLGVSSRWGLIRLQKKPE